VSVTLCVSIHSNEEAVISILDVIATHPRPMNVNSRLLVIDVEYAIDKSLTVVRGMFTEVKQRRPRLVLVWVTTRVDRSP